MPDAVVDNGDLLASMPLTISFDKAVRSSDASKGRCDREEELERWRNPPIGSDLKSQKMFEHVGRMQRWAEGRDGALDPLQKFPSPTKIIY